MQAIFDGDGDALDYFYCDDIDSRYDSFHFDIERQVKGFLAPVVGNRYTTKRAQSLYRNLNVGQCVSLVFDPTNNFDTNAIMVYPGSFDADFKMDMLGYVEKAAAKKLGTQLNYIFDDYDLNYLSKNKIRLSGLVKSAPSNSSRLVIEVVNYEFLIKEKYNGWKSLE